MTFFAFFAEIGQEFIYCDSFLIGIKDVNIVCKFSIFGDALQGVLT